MKNPFRLTEKNFLGNIVPSTFSIVLKYFLMVAGIVAVAYMIYKTTSM